jgi:hypothetical protein
MNAITVSRLLYFRRSIIFLIRTQSRSWRFSDSDCLLNTCSILPIALWSYASSLPNRSFLSGLSTRVSYCIYFFRTFLSSVSYFTLSFYLLYRSSSSCFLDSVVGLTCLSCVTSTDRSSIAFSRLIIFSNRLTFIEMIFV